MAKYDWKQLEKEYLLGDYKSVSAFLKEKKIPSNGSTRKQTNGWTEKKRQKQDKTKTKTIEKVIEKQSEKEADKKVTINTVAETLLNKIVKLSNKDDTDVKSIKTLTSALKDINDVIDDKDNNSNGDGKINELIGALNDYKKNR